MLLVCVYIARHLCIRACLLRQLHRSLGTVCHAVNHQILLRAQKTKTKNNSQGLDPYKTVPRASWKFNNERYQIQSLRVSQKAPPHVVVLIVERWPRCPSPALAGNGSEADSDYRCGTARRSASQSQRQDAHCDSVWWQVLPAGAKAPSCVCHCCFLITPTDGCPFDNGWNHYPRIGSQSGI